MSVLLLLLNNVAVVLRIIKPFIHISAKLRRDKSHKIFTRVFWSHSVTLMLCNTKVHLMTVHCKTSLHFHISSNSATS